MFENWLSVVFASLLVPTFNVERVSINKNIVREYHLVTFSVFCYQLWTLTIHWNLFAVALDTQVVWVALIVSRIKCTLLWFADINYKILDRWCKGLLHSFCLNSCSLFLVCMQVYVFVCVCVSFRSKNYLYLNVCL